MKFKTEVMLESFELVMVLKFAEYQQAINDGLVLAPCEFEKAMDIKAYFGEWALERLLKQIKFEKEK